MPIRSTSTAANHPKVKYLRQRIDHTIKLSVEKAAAHLKNPGQYPLPAGKDNLEFAIVDFFKALPKRKRDDFVDKMKGALTTNAAARQQKYGDLAAVDLHKAAPVADQVKALPVPDTMRLTTDDIAKLKIPGIAPKKIKAAAKPLAKDRQLRQAVAGTTLQFAVENITCNDTTDIRKDEVSISAFVISSTGEQQERNNFFSADFKKGESKAPGAAGNLFSFSIDDSTGTGFPASFAAGVFITEKDLIRNAEAANKLGTIFRIIGKVITIGSLVTIAIPAVGLPLALTIVGIGAVILLTGDFLPLAGDDISEVGADELLLEAPPFAGETFARNLDLQFIDSGFVRSGKYNIAVRWTVA